MQPIHLSAKLFCHSRHALLCTPIFLLFTKDNDDHHFVMKLFNTHRKMIYSIARNFFAPCEQDIEDAISAVLERMLLKCALLRAVEESKQKSYLSTLVTHTCLTLRRRNDAHLEILDPENLEAIPDPSDLHQIVFYYADAQSLLDAIRGLTSLEKQMLMLRHVDQLSFEEIGQQLNMSPGAVRSALSRAKKRANLMNNAKKFLKGEYLL